MIFFTFVIIPQLTSESVLISLKHKVLFPDVCTSFMDHFQSFLFDMRLIRSLPKEKLLKVVI